MAHGNGEISLGLFGTPLDTNHVDLDLFLDLRLGGDGFSELQIAPALELNLDLRPERELWGIFLNVAAPIYREISGEQEATSADVVVSIEATLGTYLTLARRHQLLLDLELAFHPLASPGELSVELGSVGLGYNVALCDAIELIIEARFDLPQGDEDFSVGLMTGFIATIPPVGAVL